MAKYYFFFGTQAYEFERSDVPEIISKKGIKAKISDSKYKLADKPSKTKAVILNVHDKTK
jgi:hypothetical protein